MPNTITVDEHVLVSAVRYALGRKTYIVSDTAAAALDAWEDLTPSARSIIERDIAGAIKDAEAAGTTVGMDIDHVVWQGTLRTIKNASTEDPDEYDDYPTVDQLARFSLFEGTAQELIEYVESLMATYGSVTVTDSTEGNGSQVKHVRITTGGWSGCEDVVSTLLHRTLATMFQTKWKRGGLFEFEFPVFMWEKQWTWGRDAIRRNRGVAPSKYVQDQLAEEKEPTR